MPLFQRAALSIMDARDRLVKPAILLIITVTETITMRHRNCYQKILSIYEYS
jgi:hypothetical protein